MLPGYKKCCYSHHERPAICCVFMTLWEREGCEIARSNLCSFLLISHIGILIEFDIFASQVMFNIKHLKYKLTPKQYLFITERFCHYRKKYWTCSEKVGDFHIHKHVLWHQCLVTMQAYNALHQIGQSNYYSHNNCKAPHKHTISWCLAYHLM